MDINRCAILFDDNIYLTNKELNRVFQQDNFNNLNNSQIDDECYYPDYLNSIIVLNTKKCCDKCRTHDLPFNKSEKISEIKYDAIHCNLFRPHSIILSIVFIHSIKS